MKTKLLIGICILLSAISVKAQNNSISLDSCYRWAKENYPLIKQQDLITQSKAFSIDNLSKANLPQLSVNGQATYQSDVTSVPIHLPGMNIPELSKDQYRVYAEVTQNIYDGGIIKTQKQLQTAQSKIENQQLEVQLYALKNRINQLYFGLLLLNEKLQKNSLLNKDIQLGLEKVNAAIANGVALKSNADILKVALLKSGQQRTAFMASQKAYQKMLSLFIHKPVNENTELALPDIIQPNTEINRPELALFSYRNNRIELNNQMLNAGIMPKIKFFVQGGVGRPGLDMLDNHSKAYYIGGLRMSIPLSGLYTLKKKKALNHIQQQKILAAKETFLFNTRIAMQEQNAEINKLHKLIASDNAIIALQKNIKETALAQLQNGVINSNDYLKEANALNQAQQNKSIHQIKLLMCAYQQKITSGN